MRRLALLLALAATLAAPTGPAAAAPPQEEHMHGATDTAAATVPILFASFGAPRTDVVAGDTVRWVNDSVRAHTVDSDDGSWASARLLGDGAFTHRFSAPGTATYHCTLHPFMRGEVDVHNVLLRPPAEPGAPGRPYVLNGRSALPAGTSLSIEADTGSGFKPAGNATVEGDGTFITEVVPTTTAAYRAVAGDDSSPAVQLFVLDRKIAATANGRGRAVKVSARVAPASHGAPVVLQLRLPQHFGWWPVARANLDHHSMARFSLRLAHRYPARVVLTLKDGATTLATSRILHVGPR
jgi:plastocyanin